MGRKSLGPIGLATFGIKVMYVWFMVGESLPVFMKDMTMVRKS